MPSRIRHHLPSVFHDQPIQTSQTPRAFLKPDRTPPTQVVSASPASDDAQPLIRGLDAEIAALYPGAPIEGIDPTEFEASGGYFVLAKHADEAVACGGFRRVDDRCVEIKRLFVRADLRRRGIARQILQHLEEEIRRRGFHTIVLETGCNNAAAIALYTAEGYFPIPAFLGYVGIPISRCYAKQA